MSEVTQDDVKVLYDKASVDKRILLANKIGADINDVDLSETEHDLAIAICQQLAEDVDVNVRLALSEKIKSSDIPKDLALRLANDILEVSLPIIEFSQVLDDTDLITIARNCDERRQLAITRREKIGPELSQTLTEIGSQDVVGSLLQNQGADINEVALTLALDRFQNSPNIHSGLAQRHTLPKHIIERMVDLVSQNLKTYLLQQHDVTPFLAERLVLESRKDAKQRLLADPLSKRDAEQLVNMLDQQNKLSDELIFRALEVGDRSFFEYALAKRVNIPVNSARTLINDQGDKGFKALYLKAMLPKKDFQAINFLVDAEYHNKRNQPITKANKTSSEPDTWLTETTKTKKKWSLF
jgi:uncharacterized protein (DUF2336 family)